MMGPNLRDCYHAKNIYVSVLRQNQICIISVLDPLQMQD